MCAISWRPSRCELTRTDVQSRKEQEQVKLWNSHEDRRWIRARRTSWTNTTEERLQPEQKRPLEDTRRRPVRQHRNPSPAETPQVRSGRKMKTDLAEEKSWRGAAARDERTAKKSRIRPWIKQQWNHRTEEQNQSLVRQEKQRTKRDTTRRARAGPRRTDQHRRETKTGADQPPKRRNTSCRFYRLQEQKDRAALNQRGNQRGNKNRGVLADEKNSGSWNCPGLRRRGKPAANRGPHRVGDWLGPQRERKSRPATEKLKRNEKLLHAWAVRPRDLVSEEQK
jgi:hypothetical protein